MKCTNCGCDFPPWHGAFGLCQICNRKMWNQFEIDHIDDYDQIKELRKQGHSHHCACRQVWGDGECECDLYASGYDPYAWMRGERVKVPRCAQKA